MTQIPIDVPEYKSLQLLEYGTEQDIVDAALAYSQAALPEWRQRTGNTEVVLIQALALMLAPEVMAIQMLPSQILEQIMSMYGVTRDPGAPVTGSVRIVVTASAPMQTIPAGTRLRLVLPDTGETADFLTDEVATVITTEAAETLVPVTAEYLGARGDQTPVGTKLDVVDPLPFIESVIVADTLTGGAGHEPDAPYYARASATLARLTSTLVLAENFQYAALTRAGVGRAKVYDLYNPADPLATSPGHVAVAVADTNGQALAGDTKTELETWLAEQALASLSIHVIDPTYTTVDLEVTVKASLSVSAEQARANVTTALTNWLAPSGWDWSTTVSQNTLVAVVAAAAGVREVVDVTPGFTLAGKAPLPSLGTITVTVA